MQISPKNRRKIIVAGTLFAVTAVPSFAIFGLGDIVFDPSVYAEAIATATSAASQLRTMEANLRSFSVKNLWQTTAGQLRQTNVHNVFGETSGMNTALTTDSPGAAATAWNMSSVAVSGDTSTYLAGQNPGTSSQLSQLAMIEASDSISPDCLNAVGQYRALRAQNATAANDLQQQQLDTTADTNSEVEQLNLLNAAEAQKMTEMQSQGVLNTCLAAQTTLTNMQQRNAAAQDLNTWTAVQQERATNPSSAGNESNTWQTFLP